jgi:hypothetical protein
MAGLAFAGLPLAAWLGGCLAPVAGGDPGGQDQSSKPADGCPVRVYLIRGLWDVFSTGLNTLGDELREAGINAVVISGPDWPDLVERLVADDAAGETTPLVLIGHSYGCDDAIEVARQLGKYEIPVRLLGLIDATDPGPIAANVDHCIHLYLPNALGSIFPGEFSGNPVVPVEGNTHTTIENITLTRGNFGSAVLGVDHFNIESSAVVHSFMLDTLLDVCESAQEDAQPE